MPRQSQKQNLLSAIYERILLTFQFYCIVPFAQQLQRKRLEKDLTLFFRLYSEVLLRRYVAERSQRRRPTNKFEMDLLLHIMDEVGVAPVPPLPVAGGALPMERPWMNEAEFLSIYRMTKSAFWHIVRLIQNHPCFSNNGCGPPQQPVAHQLMVLLHYLGSAGSGGSNQRQRNLFLIGYGTASLYRRRVIRAIRGIMRPQFYKWPDHDERITMSSEVQKEFLLPNCIGAIDGTTFRLMHKPRRIDASDFHGRKDGYTISGLFLFDYKRRIRYYNTGWAGSAHDNRIFTNSVLYREATEYFSHNEYIVGDSAFKEEPFCVPTYRNPTGGTLTGTMEATNTVVGRFRVVSEHGFGHLKGRFPILNCIPMILNQDPESMWEILDMIDTCVILHNFILTHNGNNEAPFFYTERKVRRSNDPVGPLDDDEEMNQPLPEHASPGLRRERLRGYLSVKSLI